MADVPKAVSRHMAKIGAKGGNVTGGKKKKGTAWGKEMARRRWEKAKA